MRKMKLIGLALLCALVAVFGMQQGDVSAASLTARIQIMVTGSYTNAMDLQSASASPSLNNVLSLASGTGANQANLMWSDTRTLAASANEDLDFAAGGLTDAFGTVFSPVALKVLIVCAATTNTNNVVLFGDANSVPVLNTAATTLALKPGGCYVYTDPSAAGTAVTGGTGDIVQVANSGAGTSVTYSIIAMGDAS